jgi:hypothetical protein
MQNSLYYCGTAGADRHPVLLFPGFRLSPRRNDASELFLNYLNLKSVFF